MDIVCLCRFDVSTDHPEFLVERRPAVARYTADYASGQAGNAANWAPYYVQNAPPELWDDPDIIVLPCDCDEWEEGQIERALAALIEEGVPHPAGQMTREARHRKLRTVFGELNLGNRIHSTRETAAAAAAPEPEAPRAEAGGVLQAHAERAGQESAAARLRQRG
jgi:hypothetical protein